VKCAEENLQIYMIEVNENIQKDAASSGNSIIDKNYVVMIFAEWVMKKASLSSSYPSESETNSANRGRKESNVFSNGNDISPVDSASHRQDARSAIHRALSSDISNSISTSWSVGRSKAARSNEAVIRKIMLNSNSKLTVNTSSSIPSAKEFGVLSPSKSSNNNAFPEVESNPTTPKTAMKKIDTEERKNCVKNNSEVSFEDEVEREVPWNPDNEGVHIPSLELTLLSNGVYRTMTANSPKPIPFENDIFVGHLLLLVNTKPICDQYFKRFEGTAILPCLVLFISVSAPCIEIFISF
jgi:hypothetical protein